MRTRIRVVAIASAVVVWAMGVQVGTQADFSGTWVQASTEGGGGQGRGMGMMRGGFGERVTIVQDATTLKATNAQPDGTSTTFTYKLDGSESRNTVAGRQGGEPVVLVSKATWNGDKLSIATTINVSFGGNSMTFQMTDVVARTGDTLTVQSTRSGMGGGEPTTTTTTYKKAP